MHGTLTYSLHIYSLGMFFIRYAAPGVHVTQRLYTHRSIGALMVLQIEVLVTAPIVAEPVMISLNTTELYNSPDVELTKEVLLNYNMRYIKKFKMLFFNHFHIIKYDMKMTHNHIYIQYITIYKAYAYIDTDSVSYLYISNPLNKIFN